MSKQISENSVLNKVPQITIFFWIIKVLCTTVGETVSDFLNVNLGLGLTGTSILMGLLLVAMLVIQFKANKYVPKVYWLTVVLISVFGTLVTDNLTDNIGVPLEVSTILFSILLLLTFVAWYTAEKTLSVHSIFTKRREAFYWLAILFTFALGTASGDLMSEGLGLGYLVTGLIVCAVITSVSIAWRMGLDSVLSFWIVYIMTRPLGASLGDFLSQPKENGGLGLGATITSVVFLLAILITIAFLTVTKRDSRFQPSAEPETKGKHRYALVQTIVVLCVLILGSGAGYYAIHTSLVSDSSTASVSWSDLSSFRVIEEDALALVNKGDLSAAKTRIKDLETAWDDSAAHLKSADKARWKELDTGIDEVLHELRAMHQDPQACKSALDQSLAMLQ